MLGSGQVFNTGGRENRPMEFSDAAKNSRNQHGGHIALPELLCVVSKKAYLEGGSVYTPNLVKRERSAKQSILHAYRLLPKVNE